MSLESTVESNSAPSVDAEAIQDGPVRGATTAFSDIMSVSGARGVSILLSLASVTLVTHLLTPRGYSVLAYVGILAGLLFTATSAWTSTAMARYGREELERTGAMLGASWSRLAIIAPFVALAVVVVAALKLAGVLPTELTWGLLAIAIATGLSLIAAEHVNNLLEASGRMRLTAMGLALQRVLSTVGVLLLLLFGVAGSPASIALIWLFMGSALAAVLARSVWRLGLWPVVLDRGLLRRMAIFSLPMIAFAVSQYVIQAIDILILGAYRSTREVGLYALSYQGYGVLQQLATTITIVLSPLFVSLRLGDRENVIRRYYARLVPQGLLFTAVLAGLAAPFVQVVVPIVFGRAFAPAAKPLALLLLAWVFYAGASYVAPILVLHERSRAIGMINAAAATLNVAGDWVLIGVAGMGIAAPAIATGASLILIAAGYFYVSARCIGTPAVGAASMTLPAFAGVAAALALSGGASVLVGSLAVLVSALGVVLLRRPFAAADRELIEKLNIPGPAKRPVSALLKRLG